MALNVKQCALISILCVGMVAAACDVCAKGDSLPASRADEQAIFELHVKYAVDQDGNFSPGYWDDRQQIFYLWSGIHVKRESVPNLGPQHRDPLIYLPTATVKIRLIDPPIKYILLSDGRLGPGYLNREAKIFYRIQDSALLRKDAPSSAELLDPMVEKLRVESAI